MEEWNYELMEYWVEKNLLDISHYSVVPTFPYSKGV